MYRLYNVLLSIFASAAYCSLPFLYLFRRKGYDAMLERLGFCRFPMQLEKPVWMQAASVGEVMIAEKMITALKNSFPELQVLLSVTTPAGKALASGKLGAVATIVHFPFDFKRSIRRFLSAVRPSLFIMIETEIWPNLLIHARRKNIPCMIVNGRISDTSYRSYRFVKQLFTGGFGAIRIACMSSEKHAARIRSLGLSEDKIRVTGSIKYDLDADLPEEKFSSLRKAMSIDNEHTVFIAGSTAEGEETAIIHAYLKKKNMCRKPVLIIAPRHLARIAAVEKILLGKKLAFSRLSSLKQGKAERNSDIIIVDTIGDLAAIYSLGTIIFVGGSLVPTGGHNIIEPARYGKPVIFGNHMQNFQEIAEAFIEHGAGFMIHNEEELTQTIDYLLTNQAAYRAAGEEAMKLVRENAGALRSTLHEISSIISNL